VVDAPAARRIGIPTATTLHGFTRGRWRKRLFERLQRSACRRFNAVVAVSRPIAAELVRAGVARDRVHVVPNAWREWQPPLSRDEARRRLGVSNDEFLIGWVGRLSGEKGPDVLVRAMPYLRIPRAVACFIGAGPERGTLAELARQLGVPDQIRWPGELLEAGRLFPGFDVFVLTSRTEGTPIVLFEAMAAEVPIIATRAGGVPDTVADSDALLVPPEDPGALAAAIGEVWADRAGASARAHAAQKRLLTDFEPNRWISRYAAIYERLVAARARDPAWV
jgi:glycosyltransferase involved in cell wall biosynthesis